MSVEMTKKSEPFGTLLGYAPGGVAIYSSDYATANPKDYPDTSSFRSYLGHEYMGYKWQCVEFARRFLYLNYGVVFTDVGNAYEIFSLRFYVKSSMMLSYHYKLLPMVVSVLLLLVPYLFGKKAASLKALVMLPLSQRY